MSAVLDVPGQPRATEVLTRALAHREVGHALAFLGQPGLGQDAAVRGVAAALNCPVEDAGCGRCTDCRRALSGAHPALVEFAPTGAMHRVAEVREQWLPTAFTTAAPGAWKVLRIRDADRMNDASANAFLKGLEEPPPRTTWILDVADPDDLPDTILSRCRVVAFPPWDRAELSRAAAAHGLEGAERDVLVRASLGNPDRLADLVAGHDAGGEGYAFVRHREIPRSLRAEGPGFALVAARGIDGEVRARTEALKVVAATELAELDELYGDAPPRGVRARVVAEAGRRETQARTVVVQTALDDLGVWLRDVLAVRSGADPSTVVFADDPEGLREDAATLDAATLLGMLDLVTATRESLEFNVQTALALEALFLRMSALQIAA